MLENRPIVAITIGYIIGIILGLYCKISIVLLYIFCFIINILFKKPHSKKFKLISIKRYFRYTKLLITKRAIFLILSFSIISNSLTLYQNYKFQKTMENLSGKEIQTEGTIISNKKIKKYSDMYIIKIQNKKYYLNIKKSVNINLEYGDKVKILGFFIEPETRRNYKGFDYKNYLKSQGVYGNLESKNIIKVSKTTDKFDIFIYKKINNLFNGIKTIFEDNFDRKISNLIIGILLGETDEIESDVKETFSESNISHILAVSGMHVGYLIVFCNVIFMKILGKRKTYFLTIIVLIFYMFLTGLSPSVVRASIMACFMLFSKIIYRKSDVWTNISISLLILLIYNPFFIKNISLMLSYVGTIGILTYLVNFKQNNRIKDMISLTLSVTIFLIPILSIYFNKIPIFSLFISIIVGIIVFPIFILGITYIVMNKTTFFIKYFVKKFLIILVKILLKLADFGARIPLNKIYVVTPNCVELLIYYVIILISIFLLYLFKSKRKQNTVFNRRVKNLYSLLKFRYRQNNKKVVSIFLIIIIIFSIINIIPKNLRIHFIDVGQGDSCLIITPHNKKILIDGGGSESYDVGKNTLIPYLLARRIKKIDYIIVSHFDTDHSQSYAKILPELTASRIFITEQIEENDLFKQIMAIAKEKNIKVTYVKAGDIINIDGVKFSILHPQKELITNNGMNNNSMVCKLEYKSFSMLFTGDIEKEAEELILNKNIDLKADVLKVAHHRF